MTTEPLKFTIDDVKDIPPASSADKPRRGRPPGSKNGSGTRSGNSRSAGATDAKTLAQALASMDSLYNMGVMGLQMFQLSYAADQLAGSLESLRKSNEEALKASPRLAAAIANAGSVGGATAFFVANAMTLGPVLLTARLELAQKRAAAASAEEDVDNVIRIPGA